MLPGEEICRERTHLVRGRGDHRRCPGHLRNLIRESICASIVTGQDRDHKLSLHIHHQYRNIRQFISKRTRDGPDCDPRCSYKKERIFCFKSLRCPVRKRFRNRMKIHDIVHGSAVSGSCIFLNRIILSLVILNRIVLNRVMLHRIILNRIILNRIILNRIILNRVMLHRIPGYCVYRVIHMKFTI